MTPEQDPEIGRCIFREANDAFFIVHPADLRILDANPSAQRLTGQRRKQLLALTLPQLVSSQTGADIADLIRACRSTGHVSSADGYRLRTADGQVRPVSVSVSRIHLEPEPLGLLVVRDTTRQKQAEAALKVSEERFRTLAEEVHAIPWEVDARTGELTYVGPQATAILGYPVTQWYDRDFWVRHLHPDDREWVVRFRREAPAIRDSFDLEYRMLSVDGRAVWLRDMVVVVSDDSGPKQLRGLAIDITERHHAEEQLRFQKTMLECQGEASLDGILVLDPDARLLSCNRRFVEIWKVPETLTAPAGGPSLLEWLAGQTTAPEHFLDQVSRLQRHAEETSQEEVVLKDGRTLDRYSAPIRGPEGTLYGRIWYWRDITAQRRLEEALHQAQKLEAVGRLAGGVAHDFNNLLTVILGYTDLMLSGAEDANPWRTFIQEIQEAGQRAAGLTRQLLAFGRKQILQPRVLDLNEVLRHIEQMLRRVIGEHVVLDVSLDPALWPIRADPGQLEQVIVNLAANARDAMPQGGRFTLATMNTIFHGTEAQAPPGSRPGPYVMLSAGDTGSGMPPETLARVFEPFFTTKEVGKGTGLGLAMVYGIVQQSGGFITAASELGRGTTFMTYLPAVREVVSSPERAPTEVSDWPRGRETILLAEDEEAVRTLASHVLERCGYKVLTASDGEEALRLDQNYPGPIDLLVSDVVMPSLGGPELARQLVARRPALRVIYISGYTTSTTLHHGLLQGTACLLSKPFGPLTLARLVRAVLDGRQ